MGCEVKSCCCGCTLQNGSFAIGIVWVISSLYNLINGIDAVVTAYQTREDRFHRKDETVDLRVASIVRIILAAGAILCSVLLVYGALKKKAAFLRPWIWFNIAATVAGVVFLGFLIYAITAVDKEEATVLGVLLGFYIISIALGIYFIVVVRSYYLELTESPPARPCPRVPH